MYIVYLYDCLVHISVLAHYFLAISVRSKYNDSACFKVVRDAQLPIFVRNHGTRKNRRDGIVHALLPHECTIYNFVNSHILLHHKIMPELFVLFTKSKKMHNEFMRKREKFLPGVEVKDKGEVAIGGTNDVLLSAHVHKIDSIKRWRKFAKKRKYDINVISYMKEGQNIDMSNDALLPLGLKVASQVVVTEDSQITDLRRAV